MTFQIVEETIAIDSPSCLLEGILAYPCESLPESAALLLSSHPHFGGNMENYIVRYLAQNCAARGHISRHDHMQHEWSEAT
ncbi:MAG: hypothetical protein QGG73_07780 [Candidatus Hydrogenedentes bacterium]|nr:hypothetical protein [Candidatus Hydrogenedentota bacterium]